MTFQSQANGLVAFKPQVSKGTTVSGGSGFVLRTAGGPGGKISKNLYDSNEVTQDLMHSKGRHGLRKASGSYTCELSLDNHDSFYEAFFRGTWAPVLIVTEATASGATSITTTTTTIVGNTGSWITVGFRVGDVVVLTGHSTSANNSRNLRITALTATVMTVAALDGALLTLNAVADTAFTITRTGQKLINPAAGAAVKVYFTIEEYDGDIDMTEIFSDCIITSLKFSMGSSGLLMVDISWVSTGLFTTASGASAPTFTSPTLSTGLPLSCTESLLRYSSTDFTELTSWDITLDIGGVAPEVVGAVISPDVFTGQMTAAMNFTMLRSDYTKMTDFLAETTGTFHMCAQENETAPADFFSLFVPNIALGGVDKSPLSKAAGPRTQTISVPKELIGKDSTGGAFDATLVKIQVSNT
jgi:hypothetical protein